MLSLKARIILSAALVLTAFTLLTGVALDQAFRDSAKSARQERLLGEVYLLLAAAEVSADGHITLPQTLQEARFSLPGSGLYAAITDALDKTVWRSPSSLGVAAPFPELVLPGEKRFSELSDPAGMRYFVESYGVNWLAGTTPVKLTFHVIEDMQAFDEQMVQYRNDLWSWLGATALLLLLAQALVMHWGLRPLHQVAAEVSAIEAGGKERITGDYPEELKRLTDNLNTLIEHEHARQKRYRDALADLAHSLKTPLAVLRGAPGSDAALSATVEEQVQRMDKIVDYQLQRAATSGHARIAARVAVKSAAEKIFSSLRKIYSDKNIVFQLFVDDAICFRGDEGDLMELLGNLLDNACKWCRHTVRLSAALAGQQVQISVEDDGPGISAAQARQLSQRGVRMDQAVPGHGIGLAVARDIVDAYQGSIQISRSALGGAEFNVNLPAAEAVARLKDR
ncbi:MAG: ATP-binding protein [Burkholderiales bacterium]